MIFKSFSNIVKFFVKILHSIKNISLSVAKSLGSFLHLVKNALLFIVKSLGSFFLILCESIYTFFSYSVSGMVFTLKLFFLFIKNIFFGIKIVFKLFYLLLKKLLNLLKLFLINMINGLKVSVKFSFFLFKKAIYFIILFLKKSVKFLKIKSLNFVKYMVKGIFITVLLIKRMFINIGLYFKYGVLEIFVWFKLLLKNIKKIIKKIIFNFKKGLRKIFIEIPGKLFKIFYTSIFDYLEKRKIRVEELNKKRHKILIEKMSKKEKIKKEKKEAIELKKKNALLIKQAQLETKKKEKKEKKSIDLILKEWYNNLSFVKDIKNRIEMKRQTLLIDFDGEDAVRSEEKIVYKYTAKNKESGKIEKGMFAAFSKLDVHSYLLAENFEIYEITPIKKFNRSIIVSKVKKADLVFFLTQLSTFLRSGITLVEAVKILEKQTKKRQYSQLYKSVVYELTMGENFSEALSKQGEAFPRLLTNMIKTSELTGNLPETLDDMANYYNETEKTRKQMVSAMTYPSVIFVFAIVIVVFIMIFVIPEFVDIYAGMESGLPPITEMVINLSDFLQNNILYLIIGLVVFIVVYRILFTSIKMFKTLNQWVFMHLPIMGKIIIYNEVTMFTKTFGSLLNHNVFITDSMEVLSKITNNEVYKMLIFDTITNLAKGDSISNSFKNHWAFPVVAYEMLLTGERTGRLGDMMNKVSEYYQEQHRVAVNQIKVFIEPVMIVFLALVVGTILLSVILPMFNMYQIVS